MNLPWHTLLTVLAFPIALFGCVRPDPSTQLKPIIERYVGYWNSGNFEGIEMTVHPEFELYMSPEFARRNGIDSLRKEITSTRSSFPDFHLEPGEMIYGDERAAGLWTLTATAPSRTPGAAESRKIVVKGISIFHFKDGKVKDEWIAANDLSWLLQIGYEIKPPQTENPAKGE